MHGVAFLHGVISVQKIMIFLKKAAFFLFLFFRTLIRCKSQNELKKMGIDIRDSR